MKMTIIIIIYSPSSWVTGSHLGGGPERNLKETEIQTERAIDLYTHGNAPL